MADIPDALIEQLQAAYIAWNDEDTTRHDGGRCTDFYCGSQCDAAAHLEERLSDAIASVLAEYAPNDTGSRP